MPNKKQQPGRSNYLASLIANYINAEELQNFTHVDGILLKSELVLDAKRLKHYLIMKRMKWLILERIFYAKPLFRCWKKHSLRILNISIIEI
jgi:hypothetical protein